MHEHRRNLTKSTSAEHPRTSASANIEKPKAQKINEHRTSIKDKQINENHEESKKT